MSTPSRIPVLLLTGFLGSGKTSLLNRLMRARPQSRGKLAIVVNEFGDVGIDGDLLPGAMTRQVELPGGCICCILNEDLDKTLLELIDSTPDLETVVIETTGVAEPLPIAWSLDREPLSERTRLAAVITVVDATNFEQSRSLSPAVDAQVDYADILVLSKMDLMGADEPPARLAQVLDQLNPTALRLSGAAGADGAGDGVIDILWRSIADPTIPDSAEAASRRAGPGEHGAGAEHGHGHGPGHDFETFWLPIENVIDYEELVENLEGLPANYVRIKGIVRAIDGSTGSSEPRWIAFHRVGTRVSYEPLTAPASARVVAVGQGIDQARLAACLDASVVPCTD